MRRLNVSLTFDTDLPPGVVIAELPRQLPPATAERLVSIHANSFDLDDPDDGLDDEPRAFLVFNSDGSIAGPMLFSYDEANGLAAHANGVLVELPVIEDYRARTEPPTGLPIDEPLIDPDCRDGRCGSCVGGPCQHPCHGDQQ